MHHRQRLSFADGESRRGQSHQHTENETGVSAIEQLQSRREREMCSSTAAQRRLSTRTESCYGRRFTEK